MTCRRKAWEKLRALAEYQPLPCEVKLTTLQIHTLITEGPGSCSSDRFFRFLSDEKCLEYTLEDQAYRVVLLKPPGAYKPPEPKNKPKYNKDGQGVML